jgi:hypothetical protein
MAVALREKDHIMTPTTCPTCGAIHTDATSCEDDFHQMLYWEHELMAEGTVLLETHYLMVASYHLQHPHIYSSEALAGVHSDVAAYLAGSRSLDQIRSALHETARSDKRKTTITARDGNHGGYATPVEWTTRALDVVAAGKAQYVDRVRAWAESVIATLDGVDVVAR